jgi:hypothetical protein
MSKNKSHSSQSKKSGQRGVPSSAGAAASSRTGWWGAITALVALGGLAAVVMLRPKLPAPASSSNSSSPNPSTVTQFQGTASPATVAPTSAPSAQAAAGTNNLPVMEINKAVMVTVELDFGPALPTIEGALTEIERRHQPEDGKGRTFAILDAYGEPTADRKKLHLSMHVSSEKPGVGSLIFKRTGELLWQSRFIQGTNASAFEGKNLLMLLDNGAGRTFTVDGSRGPASILDASIKELNLPMREFWPDGAEREITFIYSACGCPVKVMVQRVGERTIRTKDMPVMFPDDPVVVTFISRLMGWDRQP